MLQRIRGMPRKRNRGLRVARRRRRRPASRRGIRWSCRSTAWSRASTSTCRSAAPADVGWKALMGALSDLAAMGASPLGALVALCVPGRLGRGRAGARGHGRAWPRRRRRAGARSSAATCRRRRQLVVAVTVLGTVAGGGAPVSRSGARPGDVVLVTGPCGGSAAGLRELRRPIRRRMPRRAYRRPVARLAEGDVARRSGAHAMIDVSDGLALDLHRLADASGVGFALDDVPGGRRGDPRRGARRRGGLRAVGGRRRVGRRRARGDGSTRRVCASRSASAASSTTPTLRLLGDEPLERLGWQHRLG